MVWLVEHLLLSLMILGPALAQVPPASGAPAARTRPAAAPADPQVDVAQSDGTWTVPPDFTLRARVTAITPPEPTDLAWRHGGEGLGGTVVHGVLGQHLDVGQWSPAVPVASLVPQGRFPRVLFVTFTAGRAGKAERQKPGGRGAGPAGRARTVASKDVAIEFRYHDKVVRQFTEHGPNGGTVGVVIPAGNLAGGRKPDDPAFADNVCGLLTFARRRADAVALLPWLKDVKDGEAKFPTRYAIQTDLGGYGEGTGYGIRTTDPAVIEAEVRTLRLLGVNGLRNAPLFLLDMAAKREGYGKDLHRIRDIAAMGFPVPAVNPRRAGAADPEAGCPFAPGVAARTAEGVAAVKAAVGEQKADEVWALTVDEIGSVFDKAPEGKRHVAVCPRCAEGFREYLKGLGLRPTDFGQAGWAGVAPLDIFGKDFKLEPGPDPAARGTALRAYYTAMFVNDATAKLFTPLRDALAAMNEEKRKAMEAGDTQSPAATRPFAYSYALRGNTFLMGGHSLDFFDFYRHADNGFVYEMSNRDPRVWQWDSYLCDVGRVVSAEDGLRFGVYVKPHRGAPIQRTLSAVSRGAKMLYWYTYGPDWAKGDTFAASPDALAATSKAARLIANSEGVLYGSSWAVPAQVAVVNPRSSEIWMRLAGNTPDRTAAWENAKWTYTALAHAHIPLDPLDERMLAEQNLKDLSRYKVIYVSGPNLTRAAAGKLSSWVEAGGTLYTSAGGLRFDEANQPLTALQSALGLKTRAAPEMWRREDLYRATALESYDAPARVIAPVPVGAEVTGQGSFAGKFMPAVGREVLTPAEGTEVLGRFADGGPAVTRHPFGKGAAWVVGLFAGLEYAAPIRTDHYDLSSDLTADRRGWVAAPCAAAGVRPVVDCDRPTVEGVLLRIGATGRRAVTLANWTYRVAAKAGAGKPSAGLVPLENVKLTIRGTGPVTRARSAATGEVLPVTPAGDGVAVTVPRLEEGDVLLLE